MCHSRICVKCVHGSMDVHVRARISVFMYAAHRPAARLSGCLCPVPRELVGWQDTPQRCPCEICLSSVSLSSGRPWTWLSPRHMWVRLCTAKREQTIQTESHTLIKNDKGVGWGEQWIKDPRISKVNISSNLKHLWGILQLCFYIQWHHLYDLKVWVHFFALSKHTNVWI